ncbi:hypothetical protein [Alkalibacterium indicireducens]|uniref:hypothetical protein n=1 Tax=Alkalibacterium indicireducens TaxID=398758 RepID=UPI0031F9FE80
MNVDDEFVAFKRNLSTGNTCSSTTSQYLQIFVDGKLNQGLNFLMCDWESDCMNGLDIFYIGVFIISFRDGITDIQARAVRNN